MLTSLEPVTDSGEAAAKVYTVTLGLLFAAMLGAVAAFNFCVDPAHIFDNGVYERRLAAILQSGHAAAGLGNYDARALQREVIAAMAAPPDVVALGSSRIMLVDGRLMGTSSFFNHGVDGATMEDLVAIWELYRARGFRPRAVFLGLDPWVLNRHHDQIRWTTLAATYADGMRGLGLEPEAAPEAGATRLAQLVSVKYLKASLDDFRRGRPQPHPADGEVADFTKHKDGSISYQRDFRERPQAEVDDEARRTAQTEGIYSFRDYRVLDARYAQTLARFVARLRADGVAVTFFLPPFHPTVYQAIASAQRYHQVIEAERAFRELAAKHGVPVIGSYDPGQLGCSPADFLDGLHPRRACVERLLAR